MPLELTSDELLALAREVLQIESRAVESLCTRLDQDFVAACQLCLDTPGRIVVTGMGKSGHIGNKIAATLASTGTPAFFVHAAEASHGDLGMITSHDVLLAVSYSGETDEIVTILPLVKRMGAKLLSLTGNRQSTCQRNGGSLPTEACANSQYDGNTGDG
jgi:arabinose-5-phosphate isomerase